MKRTVLTLFAAVSLCACVVTLAVSIRSYFVADDLYWSRRTGPSGLTHRTTNVFSSRGGIAVSIREGPLPPRRRNMPEASASFYYRPRRARDYPESLPASMYEVGWLRVAYGESPTRRRVVLPYWPLSLLLLLPPAVWLVKSLRLAGLRGMVRRQVCPDCRYDLRASADRCPECGRPLGLGPLALGRAETAALLVMLVSPPSTLLVLALLGVFMPPAAPAAPSGLTATVVMERRPQVHLTWTDNSRNETGFVVERVGGQWRSITCEPEQVAVLDVGLEQGTEYEYRVFATHDFGKSGPSNAVRITPGPQEP